MKKVKDFIEKYNLNSDISTRLLDLTSEIGELSKEYLKSTDYGKHEFLANKEWNDELGDVLFSLITIISSSNLSVDELLDHTLKKYEKRFDEKGSIGS